MKRYKIINNMMIAYENAKTDKLQISSEHDTYRLLKDKMANLDKEHFVGLALNSRNNLIAEYTISIGTLNSSLVHPREVFKPAILLSAAAIILAHNHPSGDPEPSESDIDLTRQLAKAGKILGIELLDHIIIGREAYQSLSKYIGV